jgi:TPR repeat protein
VAPAASPPVAAPLVAAPPATVPQAPPAEAQTAALHLDPAEVAILLKRGQDALNNGDFVAARLLLQRAAVAGSADGALALAQTFDAAVIGRLGAVGVAADAAKAREWYQKAARLGSGPAAQQVANFQQKTE